MQLKYQQMCIINLIQYLQTETLICNELPFAKGAIKPSPMPLSKPLLIKIIPKQGFFQLLLFQLHLRSLLYQKNRQLIIFLLKSYMKITIIVVFIAYIQVLYSLPSTFDFRVQPSLIKFADYSLKNQGTCVAHAWGQQLAQILSNAVSLQLKGRVRLSSQYLIECIDQGQNQICHDASLENIRTAIDYIQKYGITTIDCIKNKIFGQPRETCPRQCDEGYPFEYVFKGVFTKHSTVNQTLTSLTADESTSAFVIVKVHNSMNYYSSQKTHHLQDISGQTYQYRVAEIVGWKNKGNDIVVRLGLGQGWGYNGHANININKNSNIVVEMYTVKMATPKAFKIQKTQNQYVQY